MCALPACLVLAGYVLLSTGAIVITHLFHSWQVFLASLSVTGALGILMIVSFRISYLRFQNWFDPAHDQNLFTFLRRTTSVKDYPVSMIKEIQFTIDTIHGLSHLVAAYLQFLPAHLLPESEMEPFEEFGNSAFSLDYKHMSYLDNLANLACPTEIEAERTTRKINHTTSLSLVKRASNGHLSNNRMKSNPSSSSMICSTETLSETIAQNPNPLLPGSLAFVRGRRGPSQSSFGGSLFDMTVGSSTRSFISQGKVKSADSLDRIVQMVRRRPTPLTSSDIKLANPLPSVPTEILEIPQEMNGSEKEPQTSQSPATPTTQATPPSKEMADPRRKVSPKDDKQGLPTEDPLSQSTSPTSLSSPIHNSSSGSSRVYPLSRTTDTLLITERYWSDHAASRSPNSKRKGGPDSNCEKSPNSDIPRLGEGRRNSLHSEGTFSPTSREKNSSFSQGLHDVSGLSKGKVPVQISRSRWSTMKEDIVKTKQSKSDRQKGSDPGLGRRTSATDFRGPGFKPFLAQKAITVMAIHVQGLSDCLVGQSTDNITTFYCSVIKYISKAVIQYKGVVHYILGDRAIVSFNSTPLPLPGHMSKACSCAWYLTHTAIKSIRLPSGVGGDISERLGINIGIAGSVLTTCGYARIKESMHHVILGDVVHMAMALEKMCKYTEYDILVNDTVWDSVKYNYWTLIVDKVKTADASPFIVHSLMSLKPEAKDEWMYQLSQECQMDPYRTINDAISKVLSGERPHMSEIVSLSDTSRKLYTVKRIQELAAMGIDSTYYWELSK